VAEAQRLERAVGDEQNGAALQQLCRQILEPVAGDGVERGERLVHEDDRPVLHQRAGQGYALTHAAGQLARPYPDMVGEADAREERFRTPGHGAALAPRQAAQAMAEQNIVTRHEPRQQQILLRHHGDAAFQRRTVVSRRRGGTDKSGDEPHQGALAAAGRAQQRRAAPAFEMQAEAIEEQRPVITEAIDDDADTGRNTGHRHTCAHRPISAGSRLTCGHSRWK
jgi:hypothetical protein